MSNNVGKPDKKRMQINQQIMYTLTEIVELYPQYSFAQHLATISRRKDPKGKELIQWTDVELLSRIEKHKLELEGDQLMNITDED